MSRAVPCITGTTSVTAGTNVTVTGTGTTANPYVINSSASGTATVLNVLDTGCIDMTLTGAGTTGSPYVISAVPIINSVADNKLSCTPGGLYARPTNVQAGTNMTSITGSGTILSPYVFNVASVSVTAGTNVTVTGTGTTADPYIVNSTVTGTATVLNVLDTNCIDMTVTGAGTTPSPYVISAVPIINSVADNKLSCTSGGLYARPTNVQPGTNMTSITGTGTILDPYIFNATTQAQTPIAVVDTFSIDLTASGTNSHTLQADVIINPTVPSSATSTNPLLVNSGGLVVRRSVPATGIQTIAGNCNGLEMRADGLWAPPMKQTLAGEFFSGSTTASTVSGDTVSTPTTTLTIINPSSCYRMRVIVKFESLIGGSNAFNGIAHSYESSTMLDLNTGTFINRYGGYLAMAANNNVATPAGGFNHHCTTWRELIFYIAPGATGTLRGFNTIKTLAPPSPGLGSAVTWLLLYIDGDNIFA